MSADNSPSFIIIDAFIIVNFPRIKYHENYIFSLNERFDLTIPSQNRLQRQFLLFRNRH